MSASAKPQAVGIDFGTTNTVVAVRDAKGKVSILKLDPGSTNTDVLQTLLYLPNRKEAFFGRGAIDQYFERGMEGRFFQSIKRLLPNAEFTGTSVFGSHMGVEELVSRFLIELRTRIEAQIGPLDDLSVRFGRPARYSLDSAREGLAVVRFKQAIDQAGFKNVKLIEEPVAAAASTRAQKTDAKLVMMADLGGGTSDFTLFEPSKKGSPHVFAVHGAPVAGDAMDSDFFAARLSKSFGSEIKYQRPFSSNILTLPTSLVNLMPKWHHHAFLREKATWNFILTLRKELVDPEQKPLLENLITLVEENLGYKLHRSVEELKIELSSAAKSDFSFRSYPIEIGFPVKKSEFEKIISPTVEQILTAARDTLKIGKRNADEVEAIQFTGGTAQIPSIRSALKALFPKAEELDSDTFTAVAEGLAILEEG